ncbi:MAG: O-antigen ligase family protein [Novosphingobium sp.]|uniref:O-antigen ligase family protein n=1 Tax=Novosphingobium sp. TaxID=1874826 RepID=UPI003C7E8ACF
MRADPALVDAAPHPSRITAALALVLLAAALVLGGGGSPAPAPELVLEWLAVGLGAAWLLVPASAQAWRRVPRAAWLVCLLAIVVPVLQLVPLPPGLWHALPGREAEIQALALIGREHSWRTWSMTPERTLAALLSLLPPLVMLILASAMTARQRVWLLGTVLVGGIATLALGALQLSSGPDSPVQLYGLATPHLRGFQANYNSTADVLLAALLSAFALIRIAARHGVIPDRAGPVLGLAALAAGLFGFGVIFTASRMGIVLLPLALLAGAILLRGSLPEVNRRSLVAMAAAAVLLMLGGAALVRFNPVLATIGARFSFEKELRIELWRDGLFVARKHYPVGVGIGGFVPALVIDERLEVVRPAMPNRAHNEYIELGVEAGLFGLLAWGAILLIAARSGTVARRHPDWQVRTEVWFGGAVLILFMLHSMVDYPFRSMSLATLGALCASLLLKSPKSGAAGSNRKDYD